MVSGLDTRPNQESVIALLAGERLEGDLLGAALNKEAAQISFVRSLLATCSLLVIGTSRLALAAGGQGAGEAAAVERNGVFGRSIGLSQAAVELQVSFALLL